MKQPTLEEIVAKMVALHHELGNFQVYMANRTRPANWKGEDIEVISAVLEMIEIETEYVQRVLKERKLDVMVKQSLEDAGFKPDKP